MVKAHAVEEVLTAGVPLKSKCIPAAEAALLPLVKQASARQTSEVLHYFSNDSTPPPHTRFRTHIEVLTSTLDHPKYKKEKNI